MKKTIRVFVILIVIILIIPGMGLAQDKEKPNTVLCVTYVADWKDGASVAERDSIFALADKNIFKKNKYIKMMMRVRHFYGANSEDFIFITEYNGSGLDIIEKAVEETTRLYKEWMKDAKDRKAFNALFGKYFKGGHSDEIYTLFTKITN